MSPTASVAGQLRTAAQLVHEGRYLQAEAFARQVLARQPRNAEAHYVLALSAMHQGRAADALPVIEKTLALSGAEPKFHLLHGLCLAGAGRIEPAIAAYRKALVLRPAYFEAWANLGNLLERLGRWAEAEDAYRQAVRATPAAPAQVLNGLGMCALARGDTPAAAPWAQSSTTCRPSSRSPSSVPSRCTR